MRPFETITAVTLLIAFCGYLVPANKRPRWRAVLPALAAVMVAVQLVVEWYRWQMAPAYALAALLLALSVPRLPGRAAAAPVGVGRRAVRVAGVALGLVVMAAAIALPALFPVFRLPEPSGPYAIGTTSFDWVEESRPETLTEDPDDHRALLVQAWYPAEMEPGAEPLPVWPDASTSGPLLAGMMGLPGFVFDHLALVESHTCAGVPLASTQSTYPVVIFSHGYSGIVNQNSVQMEELASHGYVVFSIAHPYDAAAAVNPGGRVISMSSTRFMAVGDEMAEAAPLLRQSMESTDPADKDDYFRRFLAAIPAAQESQEIWVQDTLFVIDEIERLNRGEPDSPFAGRLDLERLGLFGMSMGGTVAGEVCMLDSRCKAGVNMDGAQLGDVIDGSIEQPFMMMYSAINSGQNDFVYDRGSNQLYWLTVEDTLHYDYTDFSLISPLFTAVGVTGPIDPYRMEEIMNHYLLAFFDQHLQGIDSPLLSGPDLSYPEVDFHVRSAQ